MYRTLIAATILTLLCNLSSAQTGDVSNYGKLQIKQSPQSYDSLLMELKERNSKESYNRYVNEFILIDPEKVDLSSSLPDSILEKRLKMMATEIQLPYNNVVKSYLNIYTRRGMLESVLGRGQYYFPIFEDALYKHNLPMELKMLPVIESALIPKAVSTAAAAGLWQFMASTGKYYGLEVNSFVDERSDPVKATEAACLFLKDLYRMYGDWTLVIAAYNCGPGTVNRALNRVPNATTYWDIYDYLPRETRGYVPSFIAASYAYTYHKAHNMKPVSLSHPLATDTVTINKMTHFDQITSTLGIPIEIIRDLNPQYRIDIIPATDKPYTLILPQSEIGRYISMENEILAKDTLYLAKYLNVSNLSEAARANEGRQVGSSASKGSTSGTKVTYKVKNGDTLGAIALRHKVTVKKIQGWNNIRGTKLKIGQNLIIYKK